jgi:hypothetical protein
MEWQWRPGWGNVVSRWSGSGDQVGETWWSTRCRGAAVAVPGRGPCGQTREQPRCRLAIVRVHALVADDLDVPDRIRLREHGGGEREEKGGGRG